jgi:NADH dehydrogenase/NADH:ubiquinone oxidoreductase subunit G
MDSLGSNIRVQTRGNDVLRLLPVKNDSINQDWITDKSRFCLDAFNVDRAPTLDDNSDLLLSLVDNIDVSSEGGATIQFVLGSAVDTETVFAARSFASRFSANPVLMADTKGRLNVDWDGS